MELQLLWEGPGLGGAVVIPVIIEIHTDFLRPFQTPDMTLTRRNQMLRGDDIFSKVEHKNKQTKTLTRTLQLLQPLHLLTDTTVATATTLTRLTTHYSNYSYYGYHSYYSYHCYYIYCSYYSYYTHYTAMKWHWGLRIFHGVIHEALTLH